MHTHHNRGFIALISAIIISVILLGLAVAVGSSTFFARFNALNREYKRISLGLAESCVHAALSRISLDYGYTVAGDPDYDAAAGGVVVPLDDVYGREAECLITSPLSAPAESGGKKVFSIRTKASYANAFSSLEVTATAQDPEEAPVVPPPNCVLQASPSSVPYGQAFQLLWSTSANADTLTIDHGVGSVAVSGPPWESVTPGGVGSITYEATVANEGGSNTCTATVTVTAPPPAPSCADTVMMLDRSYSMFGWPDYPNGYAQWIPNEKAAAKTLVDLYDGVSSNPLVGWGRIGDLASGRGADLVRQLSSDYASLKSSIDNGMPSNPIGYTNLGAAINVAAAELDSVRHDDDKEKVLVFVSDGIPNEPSDGMPGGTGWRSPSATASPNEWAAPSSAFASDNARASATNDDDDQGYRSFDFSVPGNATIRGIEVALEGYVAGGGPSNVSVVSDGFGSVNSDVQNWNENGSDTATIASGSGNDSNPGGSFARIDDNGGWICRTLSADNLTNLAISYRWRGDADAETNNPPGSDSGPDIGYAEYNANGDCNANSGWNQIEAHDLSNDAAWSSHAESLPSSLNDDASWALRFRNPSVPGTSAEHFRVDDVTVAGQSAPVNTSCQLQARIGDAGSFSSYRSATLPATEAPLPVLGSASDDWDNVSWSPADFANGSFRLETRFNDPDGNCDAASATAFLDHVQVRVSYSLPVDPAEYARDAASDAKGDGVSIFSIHFGDTAGLSLMAQLASASTLGSLPVTSASRAGGTATITTSVPHRLAVNQRVSMTGVSQAAFNGTYTVTGITNATTFRYALSGTGSGTGGSANPMNVFVSPSSGAMDDIFESIGRQVCPAAAPQCGNGQDDDGDALADEADPGCHTDGDAANLSSYDPDDNDEWSAPQVQAAPPPPPPPPNISIGSWVER